MSTYIAYTLKAVCHYPDHGLAPGEQLEGLPESAGVTASSFAEACQIANDVFPDCGDVIWQAVRQHQVTNPEYMKGRVLYAQKAGKRPPLITPETVYAHIPSDIRWDDSNLYDYAYDMFPETWTSDIPEGANTRLAEVSIPNDSRDVYISALMWDRKPIGLTYSTEHNSQNFITDEEAFREAYHYLKSLLPEDDPVKLCEVAVLGTRQAHRPLNIFCGDTVSF